MKKIFIIFVSALLFQWLYSQPGGASFKEKDYYNDIIIGPEAGYKFGVYKVGKWFDRDEKIKTGYLFGGINARRKFVQAGAYYNAGDFISYPGFRVGLILKKQNS